MKKLLIIALLIVGCEEPAIEGCIYDTACNYNAEATIDNNSCKYESDCADICGGNNICGCTSTIALNYDSTATFNDDTCEYPPTYEYPDFRTINGMDEYGNPTEITGDGIWGGCTVDSLLSYVNNENDFVISKSALFSIDCEYPLGDLNADGGLNVLDIVTLANCVLANNCGDLENGCAGDLNEDGQFNVVDITNLTCIMVDGCGRGDDATEATIIRNNSMVSISANGFIGGVQMTLTHSSDFSIEMTDRALYADYLTTGNETRLLVILPETEELFGFTGEFEITEVIVANSIIEIPVNLPFMASSNLSAAYPNPFNGTTSFALVIPTSSFVELFIINEDYDTVVTLSSEHMDAGTYNISWNAANTPAGYYRAVANFIDGQCFVNLHLQNNN